MRGTLSLGVMNSLIATVGRAQYHSELTITDSIFSMTVGITLHTSAIEKTRKERDDEIKVSYISSVGSSS